MIWTAAFWKGAAERGIKTFFQTFVAVAAIGGIGSTLGLGGVNWVADASIAAVATVLSIATSIGNADFTAGAPAVPAIFPPKQAGPLVTVITQPTTGNTNPVSVSSNYPPATTVPFLNPTPVQTVDPVPDASPAPTVAPVPAPTGDPASFAPPVAPVA
jgi:hypothetical protein